MYRYFYSYGNTKSTTVNSVLATIINIVFSIILVRFIGLYGSADYQKHNEELMLHERQDDILQEIAELDL